MPYATVNPFNNQLIQSFPELTDDEINAVLDRAHAAYNTWSRTPVLERCAIFAQAAKLAEERFDDLCRLTTLEMGKLYSQSVVETESIIYILKYFAEHGEDIMKPAPIFNEGDELLMMHQPQGIIISVEPWNFPLYQAIRGFAPNAIAGNVIILKHASIVPQCAAALVELLRDAGLPEGVWQNVYANHAQVDRLITDPRVRGVTLTGSVDVGRHIAATAGKSLRKTVLELGGTDAFIVLPDADLDATVDCAVAGRFFISGQVCIAPKRMIVLDEVYDQFVERFTQGASNLHPGDPFDPATTIGPLSSQAQADTVKAQIAQAIAGGASAIEIGDPVPDTGAFVQPTILTNVTKNNPIFYEEIFGPVAMIFRVKDEDEAIDLANDTYYGLGGSVHSRDIAHAVELAKRIDTGMVAINASYPSAREGKIDNYAMPFGGVKDSGYGREMGYEGVYEFCNHKVISLPVGVHATYGATNDETVITTDHRGNDEF
ncbi:succinate-semialdehyde dehydrogenase [Clostridia bacterium]|nr:succinate-semialdehyde dehydrogenase [Clostridia bacterium]